MKVQVLDVNGKKVRDVETGLFEEPIREDIIFKVAEAEKLKQPYAPTYRAGMDRSASGNVRHLRHSWKSDRGRGMARIPKKQMSRRGTQFTWIGAIVPSTRGGRRAHPPKGIGALKKINKKELKKALLSSLSYVGSSEEVKKKYISLDKVEVKLPVVVEDKVFKLKTKEFFSALKKIFGSASDVAVQKKSVRAGIGKLRGRKNKKNAGLLFVIGNKEEKKIKGIEVVNVQDLMVGDLANGGARLCMFSENAIKELGKTLGVEK